MPCFPLFLALGPPHLTCWVGPSRPQVITLAFRVGEGESNGFRHLTLLSQFTEDKMSS